MNAIKPDNAFLRDGIMTEPQGVWKITYRQTPEGQPTVSDLLNPGDQIEIRRSMCSTNRKEISVVHGVCGPFNYDISGNDYQWFSVVLSLDGKYCGHINECVAVDGVVRGLFMANDLEIKVILRCVAGPTASVKPQQLSLF